MDQTGTDWQAWYDRHAPALLFYARQITGTLAQAEDAMHDGFVRYWKRREQVDDPLAYLYRSVRSAALDQRRGDNRRHQRVLRMADAERPDVAQPWHEVARDEAEQQLREAVAHLDGPQREVLVMKIWGGLTFDQIAEAAELPRSTAAVRYRAAMNVLRESLQTKELL